MYTVIKDLEISACHRLNLNYANYTREQLVEMIDELMLYCP